MKRIALLIGVLLSLTAPATAQIVRGDQFVFGQGSVNTLPRILSGMASPEGAIVAPMGSIYVQTGTGVWTKETGTGNTGWRRQTTFINSTELRGLLSDETGTGAAVFADSPLFQNLTSVRGTGFPGLLFDNGTASIGGVFYDVAGTAMRFYTGGTAGVNEQIALTATGNLGLGVTVPAARLDIWAKQTAASPIAALGDFATNSVFNLRPHNADSTTLRVGYLGAGITAIQSTNGVATGALPLVFNPYGTNNAVGIGTVSPVAAAGGTLLTIGGATTGEQGALIRNTATGTGNYARLDLTSDTSGGRLVLDALSSTFTTNAPFGPSKTVIAGQGSGALAFSQPQGQPIQFYQSNVLRGQFTGGNFTPGASGASGLGTAALPWGTSYFLDNVRFIGTFNSLFPNTSIGVDNASMALAGGGAYSSDRGGYFDVHGNNVPTIGGWTRAVIGNTGTSEFGIYSPTMGDYALRVLGTNGRTILRSSNSEMFQFSNTSANGGYATFYRSTSTSQGYIGSGIHLMTSGINTDFVLRGESRLVLNVAGASSGIYMTGNTLIPTDNVFALGGASNRWQVVYAVNGTVQTSDRRQKNELGRAPGLAFINRLRPMAFTFKDTDTKTHYGLYAQDVLKVQADLVQGSEQEGYGLNYSEFIGPLIKAVQELSEKVDAQEKEIARLRKLVK